MHCTAIHTPSGEVGGVSITLLDSTERKPPPKVEVNSAAMLAHDMKSSLVGLHGLSRRLLKSGVGDNEKKRNEYLHLIYKEAASLEKLISGFIEYQCRKDQEQKLSRSIISLEVVIRDIFASYREIAIEDAVSLELCIDEPLNPIEADADQLRRVFSNLLANALKFSRKGGVITLAVKEEERHIAVSVTDEGIGIDSSDLPHIFDCFRRGKSVGSIKGYGIGLAVVKSIVEAHNGKISVSSTPGKGSCFSIYLPKLL
jgi:signal transduction histidine kinase